MVKMVRIKKQAQDAEKETGKAPPSTGNFLQDKECLACHRFEKEGRPDSTGSDFHGLHEDKNYIRDFLYSPRKRIPGANHAIDQPDAGGGEKIVRLLQQRNPESHLHGMNPSTFT